MASESTIHEQVQPNVNEEEKTTVQGSVSSTKESGEENSKAEDSPIEATASTETRNAKDKQNEPPAAEILKVVDASELDEPKAEPDSSSASKEIPETLPCQTMPPSEIVSQEDKLIEPPAVNIEKAIDAPKLDVLLAEENVVLNEIAEEKSITENLKSVRDHLLEFEGLETKLIEPPAIEVEKVVDAPKLDVPLAEKNVVSNKVAEKENSLIGNLKSVHESLPKSGILEAKQVEAPTVEIEEFVDAPKLDVLLAEKNVVSNKIAEKEKFITENLKGIQEPLLESGGLEAKLLEPHAAEDGKIADALKLDVLPAEENVVLKEIAENEKYITENLKSVRDHLLEFEGLETKLIEPPAIEVGKPVDAPKLDVLLEDEKVVPNKVVEKEKSISENLKITQEPLPESGGSEAKLIEPPVVEVEKIAHATTFNALVMDEIGKEKKEPINESEIPIAPESTTGTIKSLAEDVCNSESIEKEEPREPSNEVQGTEQEEQLRMIDALEPSAEATAKPKKQLDLTATQESEVKVMKELEDLESRSTEVEEQKPEGAEVEESSGKQLEHEQAEGKSDELESEDIEKGEILKDDGSLADKVEHSALQEVITSNNVDQSSPVEILEVSVDQNAESDPKDEGTSPSVMEKPVAEGEKKGIGKADTKNVESDKNENSNAIAQDSTQTYMDESINRSVSTNEVTENSIKDTVKDDEAPTLTESQRDQQTLTESQRDQKTLSESQRDQKTLSESQRDQQKEKKYDEKTETAVKGIPSEYQQPAELKLKQETAKPNAPKLEEKKVENAAKSDSNIELLAKDGDSTKPDETTISAETNRDEHKEEKQDEGTTVVHKPIKETEQPLSEVKEEKTAKNIEAQKSEKDAEKSDGLESSTKDGDGLKSSKNLPKEIPAKATQKQSNSIISKVKHSLVKAKKALIGKSNSSKTIVSQAKSDIEVK